MKRYDFNDRYFENIDTEDKAYFLGFIAADGSVVKNRWSMCIKIHIKDSDILDKFKNCIGYDGAIWLSPTYRPHMCQIQISSKELIMDLNNHHIINNKTKIIEYPSINEGMERHFLRGYFDGDGCVSYKKDKRDGTERGCVTIVGGSINMMNSINDRMCNVFNIRKNKLFGPKNKNYKYISWGGMTDFEKIYNGFYEDSSFYLERKKATFDKIIDIIKNKNKYRKS